MAAICRPHSLILALSRTVTYWKRPSEGVRAAVTSLSAAEGSRVLWLPCCWLLPLNRSGFFLGLAAVLHHNLSAMDSAALLELQKDLEEVKQLLAMATRKRVRDVLLVEQRKLETDILFKAQQQIGDSVEVQKPSAIVPPMSSCYTVKINNYGWDQSDKFVKIYITLNGVQHIPADNVQVQFAERSFELLVKDLNGKNHTMTVNNLLKPISPENSSKKVKTDTVLIMCRKKAEGKWEFLTQVEKQTKEKDKPSLDTDGDPNAGLMNVLKKIYDDGDDEMKRTLNKAWAESREKQLKGDMDF